MKERPIIFSGEMVRAIREGRKTQTRRVIKPQPYLSKMDPGKWGVKTDGRSVGMALINATEWDVKYYCSRWNRAPQSGDRLWVRETWRETNSPDVMYRADRWEEVDAYYGLRWRPSIFMPRRASRILLEITDVRVERVQDITGRDATSEGWPGGDAARRTALEVRPPTASGNAAIEWFVGLWNTINAKRGYGWDTNPWVWALTFKEVRDDALLHEVQRTTPAHKTEGSDAETLDVLEM